MEAAMSKIARKNTEAYLCMYRKMARIRTFEDNANQLYLSAKMPGLTHMYSGQEAVAVGICEALERTDKITSTHRGHGHCIGLAQTPVSRARKDEGPFFVVLNAYRYMGHHVGDTNREYYRSKEEEAYWKTERDPIVSFGRWLQSAGLASAADLAAIDADVHADASNAVNYGLAAPYPDAGKVVRHVFTDLMITA
jgi:TPP-dependent pyruvate/acetoin dehydrogenase alpha subunit